MDTCPDMDLLRAPVDEKARAHLATCETCAALVLLARAAQSGDGSGDATDDCARAEPLIAVTGASALDRDDRAFLDAHLLTCARCLSAVAMSLAPDDEPHPHPWRTPMSQSPPLVPASHASRWRTLAAAACLVALGAVAAIALPRSDDERTYRPEARVAQPPVPEAAPPPVAPDATPREVSPSPPGPTAKSREDEPAARKPPHKIISEPPAPAPAPPDDTTSADQVPERLDRAAVSRGISQVKPRVAECRAHGTGMVRVKIVIAPDGSVTSTEAADASPALQRCIASALARATFTRSQFGITVNYPFVFK